MKKRVWTNLSKVVASIMALQLVMPYGNLSAAPISSMSQVNSWMFGQSINNSRDRELIRVIKPDLVQRGIYEWVGTQLQDRNYDGLSASVSSLQSSGIAIGGGVSATWWAPKYETLASGVNVNEAGYDANVDYCHIDPNTTSGMNQLIFKAKKQIDMGIDQIEFDELYNQNNARNIFTTLRNYATSKGKTILLGANNYFYTGSDGLVDYNQWYIPFNACEGVNNIAELRTRNQSSKVPVLYFQDHWGSGTTGPSDTSYYPGFFRAGYAQVLAGGGFPGEFKSWMNSYDTYQNGCFAIVAGQSKFMKENGQLWHNLSYITPSTLTSSASNVYMSAFGQSGRTVLHLVNGNYNSSTKGMNTQSNFTTQISLSTAPSKIWMTTPDKLATSRKQTLAYTYSGGVATITVPELKYNDVVVIEQGTTYNPTYAPMQVVFPFPNPTNIAVGNNFRFSAVQTEGWNDQMNWYVNNVLWGNSTYGTIDGNGFYVAPTTIPSGGTVTIKAVSKDDASVSASVNATITSAPSITWTETFANDTVGNRPASWQVVNGNGDWKVNSDNGTKVLHNYNISEGRVEQFQTGAGGNLSGALHEPMMVGGNNSWTNYSYGVSVKPIKQPYIWYGINSEFVDTYAGLIFRFKDAWNYYVYRWASDGNLRLYKVVGGVESKVGGDVSCPFLPTNSYTDLRVNVNGSNFTAYMNGVAVRSDSDSSITNGSVGCLSNLMENYFKNISVGAANSVVLQNQGFESASISPWTTNGTASVVNNNAHWGTYAGSISVNNQNLQQTISGLLPNTKYTLSGWGKSPNGGTVYIGAKDFGGTELNKAITSTSYSQTSLTFTTGSSNTSATIYAWEPVGANYTVYIDDLNITKSSDAIVTGATYKIISKSSVKALEQVGFTATDGVLIDQWTDNGGNNQKWRIDDMGSGYYKLTNINSGKCLDVPGYSNIDGLQLDQWTDAGGDNQRFKLVDLGGGCFSITAKCNGKALDVAGNSTANGAAIDQYTYSGSNNQQWILQKQ